MTFSVTQHGKPLDPSKYTWDPSTKTFSTRESEESFQELKQQLL